MNVLVTVELPCPKEEFKTLIGLLQREAPLVFPEKSLLKYDICEFIYLLRTRGLEPRALIDLNVGLDMADIADGAKTSPSRRLAAALITFLAMTETQIDFGIPLVECAASSSLDRARKVYALIRRTDNAPAHLLAQFALHQIDCIPCSAFPAIDTAAAETFQGKIEMPFRQDYAALLKIMSLHNGKQEGVLKFRDFIDWCLRDYLLGACNTLFALIFFSPRPGPNMLKQKGKVSRDERIAGLRNAAWDLSIVHAWADRARRRIDQREAWFLASFDRSLRLIADALMVPNVNDRTKRKAWHRLVAAYWGPRDAPGILATMEMMERERHNGCRNPKRYWNEENLSQLIAELEAETFR